MNSETGSSHFLIAAPSSGSGKTTLTLGLLRALANRGLRVQPFKCGPDYIDTLHHGTAAKTPSINLDLFMASGEHITESYHRYGDGADVAVTEGVMGLFDGANRMQGSSASLAEWLNMPVILVINAKAMAYSVAPLLYGFKHFYKGINLAGAIFNFVGSPSHYRFLADACADVGVDALGYLPANPEFAIPSRHLGLRISAETNYERIIDTIARELPKTVHLDRLLAITRRDVSETGGAKPAQSTSAFRISVARDEAFSFMYQQNLDVLARFGQLTFFSPLHDGTLPPTDFLYLPGGYPELFAQALSQNESMRNSLRAYCEKGGKAYAECGGLMYLSQSLQDSDGTIRPMTGVLNLTTSMLSPKLTLGYRQIDWNGLMLRGHEFHYSSLQELTSLPSIGTVTNAQGMPVDVKLYRTRNTFASYVHLYWGDKPAFIQQFLSSPMRETNPLTTAPAA